MNEYFLLGYLTFLLFTYWLIQRNLVKEKDSYIKYIQHRQDLESSFYFRLWHIYIESVKSIALQQEIDSQPPGPDQAEDDQDPHIPE